MSFIIYIYPDIMFLFIAIVILLYVLSLFTRSAQVVFRKEKVFPLRGILALLIVLHHITFETDSVLLQPFHSWGAPVVSVFFFISGYGLMTSYNNHGPGYLSGFVKHRMFDSVTIPFLLSLVLYRCLAEAPSPIEAVSLLMKGGIPPLPHSWYVFVILAFYLFFYLSCRIMKGKYVLLILAVLCIAYSMGVRQLGYARCWYISALAFPAGAFYACYQEQLLSLFRNRHLVIPVCLLLSMSIYLSHNEIGYMLVYILIPFMVIYLCSVLGVERLGNVKAIRFLSNVSYEIYLCQGIAMLLSWRSSLAQSTAGYVLSVFLLTFLFAYAVRYAKVFLMNHGI